MSSIVSRASPVISRIRSDAVRYAFIADFVNGRSPSPFSRVSARTSGGQVFSAEVMHARGSLAQPMTNAEIAQKLRDLAATGCPRCEADRVIDAI